MSFSKAALAKMLIAICVLVIAVGGAIWYWHGARRAPVALRTMAVQRGNLVATVGATGTIEPEEVIDVGTQVVGMIKEFGPDPHDSTRHIDYLAAVEEGTVLARIDDAVYRARVDKAAAAVEQARAAVDQAQANLRRSRADLLQLKARSFQADRDWGRAQKLGPVLAMSQADLDSYQAAYEVATANVQVGEATIEQNQAAILVAEKTLAAATADLREAQKNLDYTVIRSPVKGVIVDRRVNVGQTVVSSLNAPSLFLLAKDLKRLQVWASVNEADIGRLRPGQAVQFTVDAFTDDVFQGLVNQVRLNATMTQNVVTYTVVVDTDNSSGKLLPYLTANLRFEIGRRQNALLVPNAALRWQPQPEQIAPEVRQDFLQSQSRPKRMASPVSAAGATKPHDRGLVWVPENGFVRPIEVTLGLTDGLQTEIVRGKLHEGDQVVVGEELPAETDGTSSPFSPQMFGRGRR